MRRIVRRAILLSFALASTLSYAQKRLITDKDIFDFHWIGDVQLSPSGKTVAFVQATVTPDHSGYQTAIYLLDLSTPGAEPKLLTPGTHDSSPRFSPDGTQLAFTRAAEREGRPSPPQVYLIAVPTGTLSAESKPSPIKISDLPKGAGSPQWTPDGHALTVTSSTPQDQPKAKLEAAKLGRATGDAAHVSDIHIINRSSWRFNGEGYTDPTMVPQLYMIYLPKPDGTQDPAWQLTAGRFGVQDYLWRKGSNWLLYSATPIEEPGYEEFPHPTLYGLDLPTGTHPKDAPAPAFAIPMKLEARGLALSPDGDHLAFHAAAEGPRAISHAETDLWVQNLKWTKKSAELSGEPHNLTAAKGYEMGSGVGGDNTAPRGGGRDGMKWSADSKSILDIAGFRGSALLTHVDASSGDLATLTAPKQSVLTFVASPDDSTILALISNPILIGDLFTIAKPDPASEARTPLGAQTQITHVNDALFSHLNLTMPQDLRVKPTVKPQDIPELSIDTFVQLPPDYDPASRKPLPLILNIHGGPHSAYGWVFDHEMQYMAAKGYVVDYPNPRGSTTYGQNFANIIENNYPGNDFHDLMDTVDAIIAKGWATEDKLGVTGGSGGGLLTDWVVTQTTRFKAAVAQRDITDWANWWYTADVGGFHQSFYPKTPPFDNVELYRAHSPITFVNNIKTPMMFILGDADYRTPPGAGGEQFFRALKYKCIPTVMVRFPRESHELSRSGEPWHRVERLENIVNWMDLYLKNIPQPQYDVAPNYTCKVPTTH